MARKKININNIENQVLEEEIVDFGENDTEISSMSSVGASQEVSAAKPKRKGLLFLTLIMVFIILLSVTLKIILPQGTPIPTIDIKFKCNTNIQINIEASGQLSNRTQLLPGDTLEAKVEFWLEATEKTDYSLKNQVFVKTRIYGKLDNKFENELFGYELDGNWYKSINGYYYYNKMITLAPQGEEIVKEKFDTSIKIEETVGNDYQGKNVELIIEFSILQAQYDAISDVWKDAPASWKEEMVEKYPDQL